MEELDPVEIVQIQMDGARTSTSGLALMIDTGSTSVPTARSCVDNVKFHHTTNIFDDLSLAH